MTRDELRAQLDELQRETCAGELELLRQPAYNDTMIANGHPDAIVAVNWFARLAAAFA